MTTTLRLEHAELCTVCRDLLPTGTTVVVDRCRTVTCLGCVGHRAEGLPQVGRDPWAVIDDADLRTRLQARRVAVPRPLAISA